LTAALGSTLITDQSVSKEKVMATETSSRRRKECRPSELLTAALELFVEKGFAATRLDDVAARAGVAKGTVYLYFPSKEELFKAVIREGILPALAEGQSFAAQHTGDTANLLREIAYGWWRLIGATPLAGVPKLMISECRNFPEVAQFYFDNVIVPFRRLVGSVIERGIARGEFAPVKVESAIEAVFAPLLLMVIWRFSMAACCRGTATDPYEFIDQHLAIVLSGLERRTD
jgi:AcrR family transcriptional regulator